MKRFPAKLILFGEHIVLKGASALAIPFHHYGGRWKQKAGEDAGYPGLSDFLEYLNGLKSQDQLILTLKLEQFGKDIQEGWYFESDIPYGYGLGSSGALCAAINSRYGEPPSKLEIKPLQKGLAQMESFFHGTSSGTDPLISYLQVPLSLSKGKIYPPLWQVHTEELMGSFFLLDSQQTRVSGPFIEQFLQHYEDPSYSIRVEEELIPSTEKAIKSLLSGDQMTLADSFQQISRFQLHWMDWMVLPEVKPFWRDGLDSRNFFLKVCGAGGGGFYLGFARDMQATKDYFDQKNTSLLWLEEG